MNRPTLQRLSYFCLISILTLTIFPVTVFANHNPNPSNVSIAQDGLFPTPGDYDQTMTSDGIERRYLVHIPDSYDSAAPMPLVLSFHGYTDTPDDNSQYTRLIPKADTEGFIVVFPQGQGDVPGWYTHQGADREWADDPLFVRELIELLQTELNIDPLRIFATGMSNGGGMAGRVGCDLSDVVAAIAPVSANHVHNDPCHPRRPVPVFAIHGRADTVTPFEGQSTLLANIPTWTAHWVENNGCDTEPVLSSETYISDMADFETEVNIETYANCTDDATVILNIYEEMGHTFPAATAADDIWEFFEAHPLSEKYLDGVPEPIVEETPDEGVVTLQIPPGDYVGTVNSSAGERDYYWVIPQSYSVDTPIPLVISFHDFDSDPISHAAISGWTDVAEEYGFIVVFPAGSGNPLRFNIRADIPEGAPDDVQVIRDLIASLSNQVNIDPDRIYVSGFSLGGGMAHRIACDLSDQIAGLATIAGGYFVDDPCEPTRSMSLITFASRDDPTIPYANSTDVLLSFLDWRFEWIAHNNCDLGATVSNRDGLNIANWQDCNDDAEIMSYTYDSVGHTYPPNAARIIWQFFENVYTGE